MREFHSMAEFAVHLGEMILVEAEAEHAALEKAAQLVEKTAKERIGTEYEDWPELAASTLDEKARLGYSIPDPLLRTGDMRESIEHHTEIHEAEVGSNEDKAVWHELGTSRMPARSFLASSARDKEDEIVEIVGGAVVIALTGEAIGRI